jgi:hypothetical protein
MILILFGVIAVAYIAYCESQHKINRLEDENKRLRDEEFLRKRKDNGY